MCNPTAMGIAGALSSGVGQVMNARAQAQNQIGQYNAQTQAMEATNDRQRLLRALERQRQNQMNAQQMQQFGRAMADAAPEQMQAREAQGAQEQQDLAAAVRAQTSRDNPLPGTSIPGGSGVMAGANRLVESNLERDAQSLAERSAGLNAFPEAMARLGELFQGPQFNIGRLARDSQMSRGLLPNEMDAARIAPRMPAPESNPLGQILAGIGPMLTQQYGVRRGQQNYNQGQFDQFMNMIPNTPFSPYGRGGG